MKLICCTAMVVIVSAVALSQTPKSGALLEINGSSIDLKIYDSQIHTGTVRTVPVAGTCLALDQIPTDAYVLQGGAPTGCDPDDPFETSQGPGTASLSGGVYTFAITTAYCITGGPFAGETSCTTVGPGTGCNSAGTICASPDTGFLTVKNTSGTPFVGTISNHTLHCHHWRHTRRSARTRTGRTNRNRNIARAFIARLQSRDILRHEVHSLRGFQCAQ